MFALDTVCILEGNVYSMELYLESLIDGHESVGAPEG